MFLMRSDQSVEDDGLHLPQKDDMYSRYSELARDVMDIKETNESNLVPIEEMRRELATLKDMMLEILTLHDEQKKELRGRR